MYCVKCHMNYAMHLKLINILKHRAYVRGPKKYGTLTPILTRTLEEESLYQEP